MIIIYKILIGPNKKASLKNNVTQEIFKKYLNFTKKLYNNIKKFMIEILQNFLSIESEQNQQNHMLAIYGHLQSPNLQKIN